MKKLLILTIVGLLSTVLISCGDSGGGSSADNSTDTPSGLTASVSNGTVHLSWNSVVGATSYKVHRSTQTFRGVADYETLANYSTTHVTVTLTEITGLMNGTTYYFVVTALKDGQESPASNEVIGLPDFPIPLVPTSLTVTSVGNGTVNLNWNRVAGATSYKVHQSTETFSGVADYEALVSYSSTHVTATSIEIAELTNGALYYFVVTALANGKESSVSDEVSGLPDFPIPPKPTSLVASASSGTINLNWTGSDGATYKVHQSTETFASMVESNYGMLSAYQSTEVNTNSIEITGLTNGTTYYFVIMALANGKESTVSDEVNGTPFAPRRLNDTGMTWGGHYGSGNQSGADCSPTGFEDGTEQDCHQGRDAAAVAGTLTKIGGGNAGFDFTKLSSTGTVLSIQNSTWSDGGSESSGTKWSCVRDNVTGAVWEVKVNDINSIHNRDKTYTYGNWTALVEGSNTAELCGYNDWRIPTIVELDSIVDLSGSSPTIDSHYFPNTVSAFWSSSNVEYENDSGASAWWILSFSGNSEDTRPFFKSTRVRLIRSSFTALNEWPDSRYTDHKDGTVTDNVTDLMWAKCALGQSGTDCSSGSSTEHTWKEALDEASTSTLASYDDWRLPNRKELRSIVAYDRINPSINENVFPNTVSDSFSSSSPYANDSDRVWILLFGDGGFFVERNESYNVRSVANYHVRFVRSSQ